MKLSSRTVRTSRCRIFIEEASFSSLETFLRGYIRKKVKLFVLADEHTFAYCLPVLCSGSPSLKQAEVVKIGYGEPVKCLQTVSWLWDELIRRKAEKNTLLINLGGGVITDLGGFTASCFKRGIPFIHIPTTLIGQIDAAIGGKTGVNVSDLKNQIGVVNLPEAVFIFPVLLRTLDSVHLVSGLAEVVKSALILDDGFWNRLQKTTVAELLSLPYDGAHWREIIRTTVCLKNKLVRKDPFESNQRRLLNFGHTVGHAIESLCLKQEQPLEHGYGIAAGIFTESCLSESCGLLSPTHRESICRYVVSNFGKLPLRYEHVDLITDLMFHDKKNRFGKICCTLLARPGKGVINQLCQPEMIKNALREYINFTL